MATVIVVCTTWWKQALHGRMPGANTTVLSLATGSRFGFQRVVQLLSRLLGTEEGMEGQVDCRRHLWYAAF